MGSIAIRFFLIEARTGSFERDLHAAERSLRRIERLIRNRR